MPGSLGSGAAAKKERSSSTTVGSGSGVHLAGGMGVGGLLRRQKGRNCFIDCRRRIKSLRRMAGWSKEAGLVLLLLLIIIIGARSRRVRRVAKDTPLPFRRLVVLLLLVVVVVVLLVVYKSAVLLLRALGSFLLLLRALEFLNVLCP